MRPELNFELYQGSGVPIGDRNQRVPEYTPLDGADPRCYIADAGLRDAVNVALALGQPLLVTGEPGTGKTQLAASIAYELGLPLLRFYTKTTSTATDLFYQYDALRRFQDAHLSDAPPGGVEQYITYQALGQAILLSQPAGSADALLPDDLRGAGPTRAVVLIDEIDKAPRDLPNDVLNEVEQMAFTVHETGRRFQAEQRYRPILVLTSNSEKNLPDPFLRRCLFYHIPFPSDEHLQAIVQKRFAGQPEFTPAFIESVIAHFREIRNLALKKKPATGEFLPWVRVLQALDLDPQHPQPGQREALALSYSILAKSQEDLALLKKKLYRETEVSPA